MPRPEAMVRQPRQPWHVPFIPQPAAWCIRGCNHGVASCTGGPRSCTVYIADLGAACTRAHQLASCPHLLPDKAERRGALAAAARSSLPWQWPPLPCLLCPPCPPCPLCQVGVHQRQGQRGWHLHWAHRPPCRPCPPCHQWLLWLLRPLLLLPACGRGRAGEEGRVVRWVVVAQWVRRRGAGSMHARGAGWTLKLGDKINITDKRRADDTGC